LVKRPLAVTLTVPSLQKRNATMCVVLREASGSGLVAEQRPHLPHLQHPAAPLVQKRSEPERPRRRPRWRRLGCLLRPAHWSAPWQLPPAALHRWPTGALQLGGHNYSRPSHLPLPFVLALRSKHCLLRNLCRRRGSKKRLLQLPCPRQLLPRVPAHRHFPRLPAPAPTLQVARSFRCWAGRVHRQLPVQAQPLQLRGN